MALRQRSRTNPMLIVVLSVVCLALIGVGVWLFLTGYINEGQDIASIFQIEDLDPNAKNGRLPGSPKDEKSPGEQMFGYRINANPKFDADGTQGNLLVENPQFNEYLMVVELVYDNQVIYTSRYIAPNQYIEKVNLDRPLKTGEYPVTAYINAINPQTLELAGTLDTPVMLTVK